MARFSLRARLVLGVIVLAAAGLAVAGVVTYTSLQSFLVDRTDRSLQESSLAFDKPSRHGRCWDGGGGAPDRRPTSADFVEIRSGPSTVACSDQGGFSSVSSPPQLPDTVEAPTDGARYLNVQSQDGGSRYRVRVSLDHAGETVILASSLEDVDATLRRLLLIELLVAGAVLTGLAAIGLWVVRIGLRPLDAIGVTADAIAAGDLTQRVEWADERTEVGRLGLALNAMLSQIEGAFRGKEASERKLRQFVADASHELRTPLAAVRAYAELFSRGAADNPNDLERSMTGIRRESERMSMLVDDLLLLARLDEGRPLQRDKTELDGVVGEAVDAARALDPGRPIRTEIEPALVAGDPDRLRQALDNLLANVRAHTPAGSPVDVRLGHSDGRAVLEVADQGPGLTPEDAERVFERFYRADPSRSRASGGVGLGLSIVAAIVRAHEGRVRVASEAGKGTTFSIELPLSPAT